MNLKKYSYKISGMHCASCATLIQMDLEDAGFTCSCSYASEQVEIEGEHDIKKVIDIIKKAGYTLETK